MIAENSINPVWTHSQSHDHPQPTPDFFFFDRWALRFAFFPVAPDCRNKGAAACLYTGRFRKFLPDSADPAACRVCFTDSPDTCLRSCRTAASLPLALLHRNGIIGQIRRRVQGRIRQRETASAEFVIRRSQFLFPKDASPKNPMKHKSLIITLLTVFLHSSFAAADETVAHEEEVRKTTAVALNYCRAALHRIRRQADKSVFYEEQTRILNNLDLNRIEDPEVISLYKSILDEISQVEISERERIVINEQFRRNVHRQLGTNFFVIGAQVATGQVGNAVQSGANSWWDYRNNEVRRDSDQWKVEKTEFTSLMSRSSVFLDSFWRLSQKNNIPDRWLIRDQDLDQLGRVLNEKNAEARLRMLKRMERFMECYPPYWYYVARTQQQLGLTDDALETYQRLTDVGSGHFRQDDMLASSMANMALLQELEGHPDAARTAARVMDYSIRNWESNLVCAWVLGRHAEFDRAEELILCNLDEGVEPEQSRVALVSLYYHSDNKTKLAALLNDGQVVQDVPIPGLLLCAKLLGSDSMPNVAQDYLVATLSASVRRTNRGETVTLAAAPGWKLQDASPQVSTGNQPFQVVGYRTGQSGLHADFVPTHGIVTE